MGKTLLTKKSLFSGLLGLAFLLSVLGLSLRQVEENQDTRSEAAYAPPSLNFYDGFEGGLTSQWAVYNPENKCQIKVETPVQYGQWGTPASPDGNNNLLIFRPQDATTDCYVQKNVSGFNGGIVSLYFYDNMTNPQNIVVALKEETVASGDSVWVGLYAGQSSTEYSYQANGQIVSTGISRKVGWHKLEFFFHNGYAYASIDDYSLRFNKVATTLSAVKAVKLTAGWGTVSAMRFDGVRIENYDVQSFITVEDRARNTYKTDPAASDANVAKYLTTNLVHNQTTKEAYWTDIADTTQQGNLGEHLQRLKLLSWNALDFDDANDPYKFQVVDAGLRYLTTRYPVIADTDDSPFTSFVIPDSFSKIALASQANIAPEMVRFAVQRAGERANDLGVEGPDGNSPWMWGINGIWRATARFLYGVYAREPVHIEYGITQFERKTILEQVYIDPNDPDKKVAGRGMMWDYSYLYHGDHINFGGYGRNAGLEVTRMYSLTQGTSFAISNEKKAIADNYVSQGLSWSIFKGYLDPSVSSHFVMQKGFDPIVDAARYSLSNPLGFKHFPAADYSVRRNNDWFISVRNNSTRVMNTEGNQYWNPYCWHQSDGRMYISMTGNEYWQGSRRITNWFTRLPGTTVEVKDRLAGDPKYCSGLNTSDWSTYHGYGLSQFVGGVGNGTYGVSASDFKAVDSCLTAKRSWFYFDEEVVALGSNINCSSGNRVETYINQMPATQSTIYFNGVGHSIGTWQSIASNWAFYDGIGYYLPSTTNLIIQNRIQSRKWTDVHSTNSDATVYSDNYAQLYLDHGINPVNSLYAYAVVPGKTLTGMQTYVNSGPMTVLKQDADAHGLWDKSTNTWGMVFWKPGIVVAGYSANAASVVMSRISGSSLILSVSDPSQATKTVTVTVPHRLGATSLPPEMSITSVGTASTQVAVQVKQGNSNTGTFAVLPTPTVTPKPTNTPVPTPTPTKVPTATPTPPPTATPMPAAITGDMDGDYDLDFSDLLFLIKEFGKTVSKADLDKDGDVDIFDFGISIRNFGIKR